MPNKVGSGNMKPKVKGGSKLGVQAEVVDAGSNRVIQHTPPTDRKLAKNAPRVVSGGNDSNMAKLNRGR